MGKHPSESPEIHCLYRKCTAGKKIGKLWDSDCNHDDTMDRWNERTLTLIRSSKQRHPLMYLHNS